MAVVKHMSAQGSEGRRNHLHSGAHVRVRQLRPVEHVLLAHGVALPHDCVS